MDYFLASVLLGLGIAIDVALATFAIGPRLASSRDRWTWIGGVTLTHITFPMIGYYGFAYIYYTVPIIHVIIGVCASLLVLLFLFRQMATWLNEGNEAAQFSGIGMAVIISVSWDALWSGPAKSSQAVGWTAEQIVGSFFIAGGVVGLISLASTLGAYLVRGDGARDCVCCRILAMWLELSVIGYFGALSALRYVVGSQIAWPIVLLGSLLVGAFIFSLFWRRLVRRLR